MNRLQADPGIRARTVAELFGIARALSAQAVELYERLGSRMADLGNQTARVAFALIEAEQRRHAAALAQRMPPDLRGPPDPVRRWANLVVFEDEDLAGTRLVTPYRALAVAVRNEERAFAFWTHVSAHATDPEVRAEAEKLAHEELAHVHLLRAARRRAYHNARRHDGRQTEWLRSLSLPAFRREAANREAALSALHARVARDLARSGDPRAAVLARIAQEESVGARSLAAGGAVAEVEALPSDAELSLDHALEELEATAEFYLSVAETSRAEDVVADSQRLSETAVRRLAALS